MPSISVRTYYHKTFIPKHLPGTPKLLFRCLPLSALCASIQSSPIGGTTTVRQPERLRPTLKKVSTNVKKYIKPPERHISNFKKYIPGTLVFSIVHPSATTTSFNFQKTNDVHTSYVNKFINIIIHTKSQHHPR